MPEQHNVAVAADAPARKSAKRAPRCACPGRAVMASIAVNRVQTTYSTPVYDTSGAGDLSYLDRRLWLARDGDHDRGRESKGDSWDRGRHDLSGQSRMTTVPSTSENRCGVTIALPANDGFDESVYRSRAFNSVHVGEVAFVGDGGVKGEGRATTLARDAKCSRCDLDVTVQERKAKRSIRSRTASRNRSTNDISYKRIFAENGNMASKEEDYAAAAAAGRPVVTVLLPVRNGGSQLLDAVTSIFVCAAERDSLVPIELLVIDDGSDDGAVVAVGAAASIAGILDSGPHETVGEKVRASGRSLRALASAAEALGSAAKKRCCVVRIVRHRQSLGVARSLNEGLREAKGGLIARMDADDICAPGRLRQQVKLSRPGRLSVFSADRTKWLVGEVECFK